MARIDGFDECLCLKGKRRFLGRSFSAAALRGHIGGVKRQSGFEWRRAGESVVLLHKSCRKSVGADHHRFFEQVRTPTGCYNG